MFPAFSSHCLGPGPLLGRMSELEAFAGYALELCCRENHFEPQRLGEIGRFRSAAEAIGLRVVSIHGQFNSQSDISSSDPAVRRAGLDAGRAAIEAAAPLGAGSVIIHLSHRIRPSDSRAKCLDRALEAVEELREEARPRGVTLAIENLIPGFLMDSTDELVRALRAFPPREVGLCFDTGHWALAGCEWGLLFDLGERIVSTHIHDNLGPKTGSGEDDRHLRPGRGIIDWKKLTLSLSSMAYTGPFLLELDPSEWGAPEEIAALFNETLWGFDPHD